MNFVKHMMVLRHGTRVAIEATRNLALEILTKTDKTWTAFRC